ncbi:peptidase family M20/M25/M40 [Diaporthe helianthi]|uniref:Peptidase family M20/M25/M40 n=1 Tax=Diaporthe helianthi TaxID=158607 RepID=A0A2P5HL73_DIAHE|nr:peptidase family M20/M25/M40 [Diaporthe helianthi]
MRIAANLEERYGKNGIALLVDEGPSIVHHGESGTTYALPALSEKGTFSANISVHMKSGHSSLSAGYNSIIVMSSLIGKIHASQLHGEVRVDDPCQQSLFCIGQHVPTLGTEFLETLKRVDQNETDFNEVIPFFTEALPYLKPLTGNTQSLATIQGGIKINIIPERTTLAINLRLQLGTSIEQAKSHLEQIVKDHIAEIHADGGGTNLTFRNWSEPETVNSIKLTAHPGEREASPITPFSVDGQTPYSILQRTIRSVYDDLNLTLVAPTSLPANTDTRHYWNLTQHIFRFNPGHDMADPTDQFIRSNIHNTNERANIFGHINGVKWFSLFIRNVDQADLV